MDVILGDTPQPALTRLISVNVLDQFKSQRKDREVFPPDQRLTMEETFLIICFNRALITELCRWPIAA